MLLCRAKETSSELVPILPMALRERRLFESTDIDFVREQISLILQPHTLIPLGSTPKKPCYVEHLGLGRIGIGTIRFGQMQVHVPKFDDYYLFLTCLSGNGILQIDGQDVAIDQRRGALLAPGEQMLASFSDDCEQFFVRIDRKVLGEHGGRQTVKFQRSVDLTSPTLSPWLWQLTMLSSDPQSTDAIKSIIELTKEYERLLVTLLLAGQGHEDIGVCKTVPIPRSVKRAEDFIHSAFHQPLSLADIAKIAGVPARTLLDSFRRFRGTSPIRYLRDTRLDAARSAMHEGRVCKASEAALEVGIAHFGRFSRDYAERFGELPSQTLLRNKI